MPNDTLQFYFTTKDAWEAMLLDCESAKVSIDLERYIFIADEIGSKFLELFARKAKEGVRVRLLLDMVGSFGIYMSGRVEELKKQGIEILFFNPVKPWRVGNFTSNFFRDHRKLLLVDSKTAFIGGMGIDAKTAHWRDTEVRIVSPVIEELKIEFERMWLRALTKRRRRHAHEPVFVKHYEVVTNAPQFRRRYLYRAYINRIRNAVRSVYLTTPYFIPDARLFRVLRLAAKRGVDVRLLVPYSSDYHFIDLSNQSYFALALRAGVKIYQYKPYMLHAKTAVIDNEWGTVGTFNLDNLSLRFNYEINLVSADPSFIEALNTQFWKDLQVSDEVYREKWAKRPLLTKIKEMLTWPFHSFF